MKSVIIYNEADSRFCRNVASSFLHFFFGLFVTKIWLRNYILTFLEVESDFEETWGGRIQLQG